MAKYRKQRNILLATTAAITVTFSVALKIFGDYKNKKITELEQTSKNLENKLRKSVKQTTAIKSKLQDAKNTVEEQNKKLEYLKQRSSAGKAKVIINQKIQNVKDEAYKKSVNANATKEVVNASVEVIQNAGKDVINSIKELGSTIMSSDKSVKKAINVVKDSTNVVNAVVSNASDIVSGKALKTSKSEKKRELSSELSNLYKKCKTIKSKLDNPNTSQKDKEKCKDYLKKAKVRADQLKATIAAMN